MDIQCQWLFVGGPAHGKTCWVKAGKSVRWADEQGNEYDYKGYDYIFGGRRYKIGVQNFNDIEDKAVRMLLQSTDVEPIE